MDMTPLETSVYKIMAETGLSAQELNQLPMDEWARLTGRPTIGQLAAQAGDFEPPGIPRQPAPQQPQPEETTGTPEPQGIDVSALDMAEYAQLSTAARHGPAPKGRCRHTDSRSSTQNTAPPLAPRPGAPQDDSNVTRSPHSTARSPARRPT